MTAGFSGDRSHRQAVRLWLYAVAALIFAMVLVGGATRLTESGLSITEWKPVMGALPPLSADAWQAAFEKYQTIPQYRALNLGMSLDAFKTIYWWEWTHRLLGRLIGVAFLLPFLWFLWRGWVAPAWRAPLWFIFALGALQGAVGWWMVASGLADRVEVSQYRLATHLVLACLIYVAIIWTAQRMDERAVARMERSAIREQPRRRTWISLRSIQATDDALAGEATFRLRASAIALLILVLVQLYLGALVAGLRAGYIYNTWPLIDGAFVPEAARLFFNTPLWRNFFENTLTVQFDHRMLAYVIWAGALLHLVDVARSAKKGPMLAGALVLFAAITLQAGLGIVTLLMRAPLPLALAHQAVAMLALTAATVHTAKVAALLPRLHISAVKA